MAGGEGAGEVDDGELIDRSLSALAPGTGKQKDLGDGGGSAGDGVGGVGRGVEVEQFAEDGAGAGSGVGGKRQGMHLGSEGVVHVVGGDEGGLFGGRDFGGLGGGGGFAGEESLVGAVAQLPQADAHAKRGDEEHDEEDLLIAGNHGWLRLRAVGSVRHSSMAAASAAATRAW